MNATVHQPLEHPSLTRAYYRCDKTAFLEPLVTLIFMVLAQVVLTLRSIFPRSGCFVLIMVE